ncbi:cytochrome b/b6 domain-containing protein [Roseomonas elaeocarpi]|uniref:Cytochrome b/b6 domain-containing protein n=1 Tax=Roseomonas elaeocarpi TaxID=907779 RepID=A0ABV6JQF9_9PROT
MTSQLKPSRFVAVQPLLVRITHWINVVAMVCMIMSGWEIYDASPLFPFTFPRWATLGGWLGGAIAWHLAAMWLLVGNALVYFAYGVFRRHFLRSFLPLTPRLVWRDLTEALAFRLRHTHGTYNAVQRLSYVVVLLLGILALASGLSLWKPVQLHALASLLGGYEVARRLHFIAMAGIVAFIVLHLSLVILVPRTLVSMITGRARVPASHAEVEL